MAEPSLQIDQRLDRIESAIISIANRTLPADYVEQIESILGKEHKEEQTDDRGESSEHHSNPE